jgi:hypothetical protein
MAMPPVRAVPPAAQPWGGNGNARGRAPVAEDVHALDMFGVQAQPVDPVEPVAPFGPEVPLTRPPREQSRLVLVVLGVLLVVAFVFAGRQLLSFSPEPLISSGGGAPSTPRASASAAPTSPAPAPSPSTPGSAPSATPVAIAGVQALDPQGDESENNDLAARAIDGETDTAWRSERYDTPAFGGIKKGVGLALDLGDPTAVTSATLTAPGTDGAVELRAGDSPDYDGSTVVAQGRMDGGRVVLRTARPVQTRYLLVWFTRAPEQDNGERRVLVSEIDIR